MPLHRKLTQPPAAFWYSATGAILVAVVILALGSFFSFAGSAACSGDGCGLIAPSTVLPLLVIVALFVLAYPTLFYFFFSFEIAERSITVNSGIIFRQYETIDFDKIQAVDQERGPLLMLFGLTEVNLWTASADQLAFRAGKDGAESRPRPDARILLRKDDAHALNDLVSRAKTTGSHSSVL